MTIAAPRFLDEFGFDLCTMPEGHLALHDAEFIAIELSRRPEGHSGFERNRNIEMRFRLALFDTPIGGDEEQAYRYTLAFRDVKGDIDFIDLTGSEIYSGNASKMDGGKLNVRLTVLPSGKQYSFSCSSFQEIELTAV